MLLDLFLFFDTMRDLEEGMRLIGRINFSRNIKYKFVVGYYMYCIVLLLFFFFDSYFIE